MSEPAPLSSASEAIALKVARLIAARAAEPTNASALRRESEAIAKAMKGERVSFAPKDDGVLLVNGAPVEPAEAADAAACVLLAARLAAYGVEELIITDRAVEIDLFELAKLLGDAPTQDDPPKFFATRAVLIDKRAIPRRLVQREAVKEEAPPSPAPAASTPEPTLAPPTAARAPTPPVATPAVLPEPEPSSEPAARAEQLVEAIDIPHSDDARLGPMLTRLQDTDDIAALEPTLREFVEFADLSFRQGEWRGLVDAMAGLIAVEFRQLEQDASDQRRRVFVQALRQLANPLLIRQLAVLRHQMADDPVLVARLQAVLYRFGTDGASALMDEFANVPTTDARAIVLDALRGLKRTHDALHEWIRAGDDLLVREAAMILGALGDEQSLRMLGELLRHDEPRVRRVVVAELDRVASAAATDLLAVALGDDSPLVRARAVAALATRGTEGTRQLLPLLEREPDREVLFAAMHAVAAIGSADAVNALIACARGESTHPLRRDAAFRLQACAALVVLRTPQAMAAVGMLREDRDREVREGSQRLVAQAARRTTTTMRAVAD